MTSSIIWKVTFSQRNTPNYFPTFSILHFWSQMEVSSHGWYIPSVTQLIRMTVMVALSNQLEGEIRN